MQTKTVDGRIKPEVHGFYLARRAVLCHNKYWKGGAEIEDCEHLRVSFGAAGVGGIRRDGVRADPRRQHAAVSGGWPRCDLL